MHVCLFVEPERSIHGCQSVKNLPQILTGDKSYLALNTKA